MFKINEDKSIHITRGDVAVIEMGAIFENEALTEPEDFVFTPGDVVRFKVFEKKDCGCVVLQKDFKVTEETATVEIILEKGDTKFGSLISKPKDYWYEVELNPETKPQTILGYDEDGAKVFKLYPEGDGNNA